MTQMRILILEEEQNTLSLENKKDVKETLKAVCQTIGYDDALRLLANAMTAGATQDRLPTQAQINACNSIHGLLHGNLQIPIDRLTNKLNKK